MHLRPAGFWLRFIAWLFDTTVLGAIVAVVAMLVQLAFGFAVLEFVLGLIQRGLTGGGGAMLAFAAIVLGWLGAIIVTWIVGQVLGWLYYALFESSSMRATPGKWLLALWVVDAADEQVSFWRASARYFFKFAAFFPAIVLFIVTLGQAGMGSGSGFAVAFGISLVLAPVLLFIFYGMAGWTREKRALQDFAAGCYVVRAKELSAGRQFGVVVGVLALFLVCQILVRAKVVIRSDNPVARPTAPQRVEVPAAAPEAPVASVAASAAPAGTEAPAAAAAEAPAAAPAAASTAIATAPATAAPGTLDLCEVARAAGATEILGGEAHDQGNVQQRGSACTLVAAQYDKAVASMAVAVDAAGQYERRVRSTREIPESTFQDESGIGDKAFRMSRDNGASLVYFVLSGNRMVVVRLERVPPSYESRVRGVVARTVAAIP